MNPTFKRWMAKAARYTQVQKLEAATAAIQAALRRAAANTNTNAPADVIDIDAREVPADGRAPADAVLDAHGGRWLSGSHGEAHLTRDYKLYLPPGMPRAGLPLVVMLHGCTQDPDDFARGTGMNDAARERGFVVLYPAQAQAANPSRCWNWFKPNHQARGRGEPAVLAGMTRAVMAQHGIDPKRVYVAGLSAGGAMAAILGQAYPDLYAAVGVHSGLASGAANDAASAFAAMKGGAALPAGAPTPPTIVFHGDKDATVHPLNGEHVFAASAAPDGATAEAARSSNGRSYSRRVVRDACGGVRAEHWAVHGAGHAWSGGSARGTYTDPQGPSASAEMLRFFFEHSLPSGE